MLTVVAHLRDKVIIKNENDPYAAYQHIGTEGENKNNNGNGGGLASQVGRKIVYIAPMKALAQEVVDKFSSKLKALNIVVRELTGDMQLTRSEADRADILVTTVSFLSHSCLLITFLVIISQMIGLIFDSSLKSGMLLPERAVMIVLWEILVVY